MKKLITLLFFIAEFDVYLMVQTHFGQVANTAESSRFFIVKPDINVFYSRIHNSAAAHGARFERNIHITVDKPPTAEFFTGAVYRRYFGVLQSVFVVFAPVVARSDDLAVVNDNAADGNIIAIAKTTVNKIIKIRFISFSFPGGTSEFTSAASVG